MRSVRQTRWIVTMAAFAAAAAFLCPAGAATASTWSVEKFDGGDVGANFYGMSCPSTALCVAVGGNGTIASSVDPLGGTGAWRVFRPTGGFEPPWQLPPHSTFGGTQIKDVDCPASQLCVAATFDGRIFSSTDPSGGPDAWKAVELTPPQAPNYHLLGISCPSPGLCVAAGYGGTIVYSTFPTGEAADWHAVKLASPYDFRGISCASVSLCVAVDLDGEIVASTAPTGGAGGWASAGSPAGPERLTAIDCPSSSLCVTANASQIVTSTDPAAGSGAWHAVSAGTGIPVTGISCPTASACAAVDQNADVLVSDEPRGGAGAWSFKNVIPFDQGGEDVPMGNGAFGISCPSTNLCAGAASSYQVFTSGDPFAPDREPPARSESRRRPRVLITRHPPKRINPRKGGVEVRFVFRARGRAIGFRCKLSGRRRFRPCASPRVYRVRGGAKTFRVRALAPDGSPGPISSYHFRIGKLNEPSPAGSCANSPSPQGCVNAA